MDSPKKNEDKTMSETLGSKALIGFARIWSLASIVFVLVFLFGEGLSDPGAKPTAVEWVGLALWPGGVIVGLIVAWLRKGIGGAIAIGSLIAFYIWNLLGSGTFPRGPYFLLVAGPGFVFLLSSLLSRPTHQMRHA
jgi:hypothetical protein